MGYSITFDELRGPAHLENSVHGCQVTTLEMEFMLFEYEFYPERLPGRTPALHAGKLASATCSAPSALRLSASHA